ncbi:hypothetical protein [Mesonia maritima]|uniref:Lipoprotein n=3 Tax=Mesonia maritima TaxID=1793873 RepID=A0ABU1K5Y2_9FLAO|nr:hypothetical protein [Mesonia maritima]MDR6300655.1 hypothetical protein [Mesonia maritima]
MKFSQIILIATIFIISSCSSVPKETVTLSRTIGNDLRELEQSHTNSVNILFAKINEDIDTFIDEVYAPYIINYVLKDEYSSYQDGEESIYTSMINAANTNNKETSDKVLDDMSQFLIAAKNQIESKRKELQLPINTQRTKVINSITNSYQNVIYANSTITGHLESIRKVKEAQDEAAAMLGVENANEKVNEQLLDISDKVSGAVLNAKEIDLKSDEAYNKLEKVIDKIKELTNQN